MTVPFVDLVAQHREVAEEVEQGFARVLEAASYINGPDVKAFEEEYAAFAGVSHCVGLANGTDAVELALRASGVSAGDEVILPANTFIATAEAVQRIGARVVLVDCDAEYLMRVDEAVAAATDRTRAVVPVHLYGQMAPIEGLRQALPSTVAVVEDAAQAQGARRDGRSPGAGGTAATSFYPGKNLGAYGDAGAVVTDDPAVADRVRLLRDHGSRRRYSHEIAGMNSRLDTLQAVVLRSKLRRLAGWNDSRRAAAVRYGALLADVPGVVAPLALPGNEHVWHLYVVRVRERDQVLARLAAAGIGAGIHYPVPVHLTDAFAHLGHARGAFPSAESAADELLSLPMFPHITADQQERVVEVLAGALV